MGKKSKRRQISPSVRKFRMASPGGHMVRYNTKLGTCSRNTSASPEEEKNCVQLRFDYKRVSPSQSIPLRLEYANKCVDSKCWDEEHCNYMVEVGRGGEWEDKIKEYCDTVQSNEDTYGPLIYDLAPKRAYNPHQVMNALDMMIHNVPLVRHLPSLLDLYEQYAKSVETVIQDAPPIQSRVQTLLDLIRSSNVAVVDDEGWEIA